MRLKEWKAKVILILTAGFLLLVPAYAMSQEYPSKPINITVGFGPGGALDVATRLLANKAEKFLGQTFIITNEAGGGGSVSVTYLAKQKPDGYHLASCGSTVLVRIPQLRPVPYKVEDFTPVMIYGSSLMGLVVKADSPFKTLKDLVEYARKNPGKVTFGGGGPGTVFQMAMDFIAKQEGIQWRAVVFKEAPFALSSLLGGHTTADSTTSAAVPLVKDGSLRFLATYGEAREKQFPNVPTLKELGYNFTHDTVSMILAPKGTPEPIVEKLDVAFRKAMDDPEFIKKMEAMDFTLGYRNHEDAKKYLAEVYPRIGKMIKELKVPAAEPGKK